MCVFGIDSIMCEILYLKPKKRLTMDDMYGDGSDCTACEKCGLCLSCGDCNIYGCGSTEYKSRIHSKHQNIIRNIK